MTGLMVNNSALTVRILTIDGIMKTALFILIIFYDSVSFYCKPFLETYYLKVNEWLLYS